MKAARHISMCTRRALIERGGDYESMVAMIPVAKLCSCGNISSNEPGISISKEFKESDSEIVGEVEYVHLDRAALLEESISILSEYTTPRYHVGIRIFLHRAELRYFIFLLQILENQCL